MPKFDNLSVETAWSGFRPFCADMQPVIGRIPGVEGAYVAAGHFRQGVQLGPLTGELLADEIVTGKRDAECERFRPDRF